MLYWLVSLEEPSIKPVVTKFKELGQSGHQMKLRQLIQVPKLTRKMKSKDFSTFRPLIKDVTLSAQSQHQNLLGERKMPQINNQTTSEGVKYL